MATKRLASVGGRLFLKEKENCHFFLLLKNRVV